MATVRLVDGSLSGLDSLDVDAIAIPLFQFRGQPLGVPGYVDWRLCGRLGRLLQGGRFSGAEGEVLLMPGMGRIGAQRIFLFGLGAPETGVGPGKISRQLEGATIALRNAGVSEFALCGPSCPAARDIMPSVRVVEIWLKVLGGGRDQFGEVLVLQADGEFGDDVVHLKKAADGAGLMWLK